MEGATILQLQERLRTGELSSCDLVEHYLSRIAQLDQAGPTLNSVIEINPDALQLAEALDAERRERGPRGPLHGIPILLKDNIDTGDGMQTTAGSLALVGPPALRDAFLVERLRAGGALILGKTNLSEWANFRSPRSSSGWSSRGGQTRNPYALDRNPSGSSSGSAVAVAAGLCAAAVGTETDGSIISPANANGIVGIKPTLGLISRSGIVPIAHSQDTAGTMARTVADAALLLGAMTGVDPLDQATAGTEVWTQTDYSQFLDDDGLRGARIGVARNFFGFHPLVDEIMERSIEALKQAGAEVVDPVDIATAKEFDDSEFLVLLYEFKADLNAYLQRRGPTVPVHSLKDIITFNTEHRQEIMPFFGQELMLMAEEKGALSSEEYLQALAANRRLAGEEGIDAALRSRRLDALVAPSGGPAWLTDWINGDHYGGGSSSPAAVAGYPAISVPAGYVFGLPVGLSFIGAAYQEPTLIRLAYAFEQITQVRRPPGFPARAEVL